MSREYQIIREWIDSCNTEFQLDNIKDRLTCKAWKLEDKTTDDLLAYLNAAITRRSWVAAKVAQRDFHQVERFPACDEYHEPQPSDIS